MKFFRSQPRIRPRKMTLSFVTFVMLPREFLLP